MAKGVAETSIRILDIAKGADKIAVRKEANYYAL